MRSFTFIAALLVLLLQKCIIITSSIPIYEHAAHQIADQCDWIGSGGGGRGVRPVYLRCSRGTIVWRYPRGALRVVLSPSVLTEPIPRIDTKFKTQDNEKNNLKNQSLVINDFDVSRLSGFRTCTKIFGSVRVYLETHGKLQSLYSPRDGKHKTSHRCFYTVANKQPIALFIEAEEQSMPSERRDVKLQYDLEIRRREEAKGGVFENKNLTYRIYNNVEDEDCRPCSAEELAIAYCQSDFVVRGTMSAVEKQLNLESAELIVTVTKILRRVEDTEGCNDADVFELHGRKNIRVRIPTACDAHHGQGEFVIMAKRRLGDLILVCAPRLETWAITVRELETAPCVLRS